MMQVSLTPELESIIQDRIASGQYNTPMEIIREALRLIAERDHFLETQRESLRHDIKAGLDQLDKGLAVTPTKEEVWRKIESRLTES